MKRCYSCFNEYEDRFSVCPHCGQIEITKPVEPIHLYPGTVIADRYILGEAVGSGGFGIVYKAWDSKLETVVAVKEFFVTRLMTRAEGIKNVIISRKSQEEYEYRKKRFLAEARNMAKFGTHRSIPNVFEYFEENNTAYIVMELLQGMALNEYLAQIGGVLDTDFAIMIANEVGNALKSLHEQNIIHRDVAPDNIFICTGKEIKVKLMDLGAAKLADSTDDVIDVILKPGYSPAEQYDNSKNIGPWTDIYALGATLYMMLTGTKPDESTNRKIKDTVVPPNQLNPNVSENLSNAIMKAMAVEKHLRFNNVSDFLAAINGDKKVKTLAEEKKRRRLKRLTGILAASIIVALISGFVAHTFNEKRYEVELRPATISVWISVKEGSTEAEATQSVVKDFHEHFPNVEIEFRAIPEEDYLQEIKNALADNRLPTLFESSGLPQEILANAQDVSEVLKSPQAAECTFLAQYNDYYSQAKQVPLAIEIPVAFVITGGPVAVDYKSDYFSGLDDFGPDVVLAESSSSTDLVEWNFTAVGFASEGEFLNNEANTSPVLLGSTMDINTVRTTLTNYEKKPVFYNGDVVRCRFIYEWSIGTGNADETRAAEVLLSWMLGNVYQNTLMISECSDGQIPINTACFEAKTSLGQLAPVSELTKSFRFGPKE